MLPASRASYEFTACIERSEIGAGGADTRSVINWSLIRSCWLGRDLTDISTVEVKDVFGQLTEAGFFFVTISAASLSCGPICSICSLTPRAHVSCQAEE